MFGRLLLLFIAVPLIDLIALLRVGRLLGFWPTLALVLLMGTLGAALARAQGLRTLTRINNDLAAGRMPSDALADGALILLAGALLVTPGFLTDIVGLALLIPPVRGLFRKLLTKWFRSRVVVTRIGPGGSWPADDGLGATDSAHNGSPVRPVKRVENEALHK